MTDINWWLLSVSTDFAASGEATIRSEEQADKSAGQGAPCHPPKGCRLRTLWRQLVRVGWTSKRPTQLSNSWSYSSPNARKDPHVEGVNMRASSSSMSNCGQLRRDLTEEPKSCRPEEPGA
ncbi:hypothetical protein GQ600_4242 [Phytophthora cactorum]|nr:hypothetical protein GQ600_4242 [Phytophthora cactorum]